MYEVILMNKNEVSDYYFQSKILKRQEEVNKNQRTGVRTNLRGYIYKFPGTNHPSLDYIKAVSGIYRDKESFREYLGGLIPGSFGIWFKFRLVQPYFSSDDDVLYAVANPVLKEYISKWPMVRPSSWKGMLRTAAINIIKQEFEGDAINKALKYYLSSARIFGTGSKEFRKIESCMQNFIDENEESETLIRSLIRYALFDLGIDVSIRKNTDVSIAQQIVEKIKDTNSVKRHQSKFLTHGGRAVFYPTYFDSLDFEIINPQDRLKRAGGNIVFYEVVPKDTEGTFQMVYIPHDAVLKTDEDIKKEAGSDFAFLKELIKHIMDYEGIGAKTKLGWGRGKIKDDIEPIYGVKAWG